MQAYAQAFQRFDKDNSGAIDTKVRKLITDAVKFKSKIEEEIF